LFLFIFESIGTSELLLVGIVALIFLGPRKLPEMARKIGKIMAEFRSTTNEFKETWQREVNFEEEAKALDPNRIESEAVAREVLPATDVAAKRPVEPAIKEVDASRFNNLPTEDAIEAKTEPQPATPDLNDKANWL
jgi:sec-independent protein translocase protein TatB